MPSYDWEDKGSVCAMRHWRDKLLQPIQSVPSPLVIAEDADGLLLDEQIAMRLNAMNLAIISYGDPLSFRFVFETHFRYAIAEGKQRLLVRTITAEAIPYDILQLGHVVKIRVRDLFPGMAVSVMRELNAQDFDLLDQVYAEFRGPSTSRETLHFLLRHVYKLPYELIDTEADLYQWLLSLHARRDPLPAVVEQFLIEQLAAKEPLKALPVREWVRSAEAFYAHLQAEWQRYLEHVLPYQTVIKEGDANYEADDCHPFSIPDVRRLVNDLFIEGHLQPVSGFNIEQLPAWTHAGVVDDPVRDQQERLHKIISWLDDHVSRNQHYQDWLKTARLFGEMKYLYESMRDGLHENTIHTVEELEHTLDGTFTEWMLKSYQGLSSLPHLPAPVMVHHIPHYLATSDFSKVALIVLDGMSVVQWAHIKHILTTEFQLAENGVFAWVPTLTSVSRQALFSGKIPLYFADSLWTTNKEKQHWTRFWEDCGVSKQYIAYERNLGQESYDRRNFRFLSKPQVKIAGLVINTIDKLTHGAIQGHAGIQAELQLWLRQGYLQQLLRDLEAAGFTIYLTSDHGNKECIGMGRVSDGVLVETKGERVRIYDDPVLYRERAEQFAAIKWSNTGLPDDSFSLIAQGNQAFTKAGQRIVSHGGISLEEVIVPFVQVTEMR